MQRSIMSNMGKEKIFLQEEKDDLLDLVNKVQMFRIAIKKINNKLVVKGKTPVFKLADDKENLRYDM